MTTKKKLIISITTLCVAVVAAIGITFGVLAAQNQSVANNFSVTYTASNVAATVSAKQKVKGGEVVNFVDAGNNNATTVTFGVSDTQGSGSLGVANAAELSLTNNYVVYQFRFTNDITSGGNAMSVTLTDSAQATNVTVKHVVSSTDLFAGTPVDDTIYSTISAASETTTTNVAAGATTYFYILVEVTDNTVDASYASGTGHAISWALAYVANNA